MLFTDVNEEGAIVAEQFRMEGLFDRMDVIGKAVLGLSLQCAQCHTHKYDPISHAEYFQLYAFFNSTVEPKLPLPTPAQDQRLRELNAELAHAKKPPPPRKQSPEELQKLLAELEQETNGGWRPIYPKAVTSAQGAMLSALEDRSVLAGGKVGESDTYTVESVAPEKIVEAGESASNRARVCAMSSSARDRLLSRHWRARRTSDSTCSV